MRCVVVASVGMLAFAGAAHASVSFDQISVEATASMVSPQIGSNSDSDLDQVLSPALPASLDAAVSVTYDQPGWDLQADSASSVSIAGSTITGGASIHRQWSTPGGQTFNAASTTHAKVWFTLTQATDFWLDGAWTSNGPVMAGINFDIIDTATNLSVYGFGGSTVVPNSFSDTGTLAAGAYVLQLIVQHSGQNFSGVGERYNSLDFVFTIPAPGAGCALAMLGVAGLRRRR